MSQGRGAGALDVWSGMGLVAANMIGAGVFLSAGYMAQTMSAGWILIDWLFGLALALAGARAYAEVARLIPRSGGEYRYLSELIHPSFGYMAGWASLLIGFSAPIAINALGAAAFLGTVVDVPYPRALASGFIALLALSHGVTLVASKWSQNALVALKVALLVGFVVIGLALGESSWPDWRPPGGSGGFEIGPFMGNMFWIAFAFSGWNAAIYAAGEFRDPGRDVARSMLLGCAAVGGLYLLVNWVFVANLTPEDAGAVIGDQTTTLAHAVTAKLIGGPAAGFVSIAVALAFLSAMSAMTLVGPRVYAAMAEDGFLPRALAARAGRPPVGSIVFQSAVSIAIVWTHSVRSALDSVGALLILFSALTCTTLFAIRWRRPDLPRPRPVALAAAAAYIALSAWVLFYGVRHRISPQLLAGAAAVLLASLIAYLVTERLRRRR
ncbi:MAG TPA: APC family permease [Kofleriaceae bacterium]|nr:APC family permease [Kofleriaceae bacterium]